MSASFPKHAQVVVIGGGIHGCSVAYHLAKNGWKDVVLVERKKLTSGTTWHAAGLVGQLQGTHATTAFASYGVELLQEIEAETGLSPGFRQNGSISIAVNQSRLSELKRKADFAKLFGVEASFIETDAIAERWPLMNAEGVLGGIYMPSDGSANPTDLTQALARGARMNGAKIFENIKVETVLTSGGKVTGVETDAGISPPSLLLTAPECGRAILAEKMVLAFRFMLANIITLLPNRFLVCHRIFRFFGHIVTAPIGKRMLASCYLALPISMQRHGQKTAFQIVSNLTVCLSSKMT
jgi:hypothetical protein